jgi:hypothetical protein
MPTYRILLDNNVPIHLLPRLRPNEVVHASTIGWASLTNGHLIRAARDAGFAAIVTCDRNIKHQQNLSAEPLAFIVLTTTHWPTMRDNVSSIIAAVNRIAPGGYEVVSLPRPSRRRRAYNPPRDSA